MALIDLSANIQGTSEASAGARMSMSLTATLYGRASSMQGRPPPQEPPQQSPQEPPKNEQG